MATFFIDSLLLNAALRSRNTRFDELNDHLLADIGLTRAQVARGDLRRKAPLIAFGS